MAAARELAGVVGRVLAGETRVRIDEADSHGANALNVAAHLTGVGPLLGAWAERGRVSAAPMVSARLARQIHHARLRAALMEREVIPAIDALLNRGLVPVVLKGFHTARAYFEEPGERRMADVDVWVASRSVPAAEAALTDADFVPTTAPLRPYRRDWAPSRQDRSIRSLEYSHEMNPWGLELHGSLDRVFQPGTVARFDAESSAVAPMEIAGRRILVLRQPLLLLTLAAHCSQELDGSRLLRLVELVKVVRSDESAGKLDWDATIAMMRRTGTARYTFPAFALAEQIAPGTIDGRVLALANRESTWAARHTVARLSPAGGSTDRRGVARQWMWTRGPIAVGQRLLRNVWPAGFDRPGDLPTGWSARIRRLQAGHLSLGAPDEHEVPTTPSRGPAVAASTRASATHE